MADDASKGCRKTYVLDTNVLLSDPNSLQAFDEHVVIVPLVVLEELDRHKGRNDEVGKNARQVSRALDAMRGLGSFVSGIALPNGGLLRIVPIDADVLGHVPSELRHPGVDNQIIAFMAALTKAHQSSPAEPPVLVTKDINVRIKCDSLGIRCDDYLKMRASVDPQHLYCGVEVLEVEEARLDAFYAGDRFQLTPDEVGDRRLHPNQIVVIKNVRGGQTIKSALTKCSGPDGLLVPIAKIEAAFGLRPRNKEQTFSLDLLFDDSIKLVTLVGPSGTGKTLLAIAAGLAQLRGMGDPAAARYDKLVVTKPIQPVGKDIGFLPGTLEEKMDPWIAPIRDNLNYLVNAHRNRPKRKRTEEKEPEDAYLQMMQARGLIEIEAIAFIRGRSIPNSFIIIDEAQNLSMHELKTIVTRVGDGTKIVLTGDIEQIDNVHVDVYTNGLTHAIERFKDQRIAGHVTFLKGERSELATLASKIL